MAVYAIFDHIVPSNIKADLDMKKIVKNLTLPDQGKFSNWLNDFTRTLKGEGEGQVPCGECTSCCTSSYFIHIKPTDVDSINHIPKELMFPAPRLPKGHYILGFNEKGHCPMLKEGKCSIYSHRPETCRQYDCRVFAATGIFPKDKPQIFEKAKSWKFEISSHQDKETFQAIQTASKFIIKYQNLFPKSFFPGNTTQQAVWAIRIHSEFIGINGEEIEINLKKIVDTIISKYGINKEKNNGYD